MLRISSQARKRGGCGDGNGKRSIAIPPFLRGDQGIQPGEDPDKSKPAQVCIFTLLTSANPGNKIDKQRFWLLRFALIECGPSLLA